MKIAKRFTLILVPLLVVAVSLVIPGRPFAQEDQIQKAKIFQENYQLITEADLYCSFYMHEEGKPLPTLRIIGAERMNEKIMLGDSDIIYLNQGPAEGLEIGELFEIVGLEDKIPPYGTVTLRRGRARVVRLEEKMAVAKIEKACNPVRVGDYLMPFEESEGEIGKDKGFDLMDPNASKRGQVIFIDTGFHIGGSGQWALIDMGRQHCVQIGDQLTVFHRAKPNLPREAVGNVIVIDVRGATSTVKILSCRDSIETGNEVQLNVTR